MKTVREFKDLGVVIVDGDKCTFACQEFESISRPYSDVFADSPVTHFAWRPLNTIPDNPKFKYERTGSIDSKPMWRPLLEQPKVIKSRDELISKLKSLSGGFKHYEDDEIATQKPVFTQAMADVGELPPVGSDVVVSLKEVGYSVESRDCKYEGKIVTVMAVFKNKYGTDIISIQNDTGACACYTYECVKPIDSLTPKQKAIDEMYKLWYYCDANSKNSFEAVYDAGYRKVEQGGNI